LQHILTLYKDIVEHRYSQIAEPSYVSSLDRRRRAPEVWSSTILHQEEHLLHTPFASIPTESTATEWTPEPSFYYFRIPSRQTLLVDDETEHEQLGHLDASEDQEDLRCTYPGCPYTGTFKRKYELQRHERKHNQSEQQRCLGMGCDKEFYRLDKLWDHIRASQHTVFKCPVVDCPMTFSALQEVLQHFSEHPATVKDEYRSAFGLDYIQEHINDLPHCPSEPVQSNSTPFTSSKSAVSFILRSGPGTMSSTTSVSDSSVLGGHYACPELDCNKTYTTKSGLT
jgi:hypothetical protein